MGATSKSQPSHGELAFIVSSSADKPDPKARRAIRSHVMRGKNRRRQAVDPPPERSWINQEDTKDEISQSVALYGRDFFPLSKQIGSSMPFTHFAYDMPPHDLDLVYKWFAIVGQTMYPIELCLTFDLKTSVWVEYLALDPLWCHLLLWTTQAYFDWLKGFGPSYNQAYHAHDTLALLKERLDDSQLALSDVTIACVVVLVMVNALIGGHGSSKRHMMGLYKMVELRGGVKAFKDNTSLQVKICRADLTISLLTGSRPIFFKKDICWEPYIANSENSHRECLPEFIRDLDLKVYNIWADLREFTRTANLAFQTGKKISCTLFQETLISIQYRLQTVRVGTDLPAEAMHIGMLAFSTNVFLQRPDLAVRLPRLSEQLHTSILKLQILKDQSILEFKLWLLFVAQLSFDTENASQWLMLETKNTLEALKLVSWTAVKDILRKHLWISALHDSAGNKAFADASTCDPDKLRLLINEDLREGTPDLKRQICSPLSSSCSPDDGSFKIDKTIESNYYT